MAYISGPGRACVSCGAPMPNWARFCGSCGRPAQFGLGADLSRAGQVHHRRRPMLVGGAVLLVLIVGIAGVIAVGSIGQNRPTSPARSALAVSTASPKPTQTPSFGPTARPVGSFVPAGSIRLPRQQATATRLLDGRVLIATGIDQRAGGQEAQSSAELFDPRTGTFTPTGSLPEPRFGDTAALLRDGRVLLAGGYGLVTAVLYDPATGKFTPTGSMRESHNFGTATVLGDGRVLVVGGGDKCGQEGCPVTAGAEIYDPSTGKFASTGSMAVGRLNHAATLLRDGRVLVVGGNPGGPAGPDAAAIAECEIYDPATGAFMKTDSLTFSREKAAAVLLDDGRVLVAAGSQGHHDRMQSEIYDPTSRRFTLGPQMLAVRAGSQGFLMEDGRVFVTGLAAGAEVYDPQINAFQRVPDTGPIRNGPAVSLLEDGRVLVAGGADLTSAEFYIPSPDN